MKPVPHLYLINFPQCLHASLYSVLGSYLSKCSHAFDLPLLCPIENVNIHIGDLMMQCEHCHAYMWCKERMCKHRDTTTPRYHLCYGDGKVELPLLKESPVVLHHLLFDNNSKDGKNDQHI